MMEINSEYEILTPTGWQDFNGIINKGKKDTYKVICESGDYFIGTEDHKMINSDNEEIKISDIKVGDQLKTVDGFDVVAEKNYFDNSDVYDVIEVDNGHQFVVNSKFVSVNCDEMAFVPTRVSQDFWTAISPVLSTGGDCIITSTPNSDEDMFAKIWQLANIHHDELGNPLEGDEGINDFYAMKFPYYNWPGRDEKWAESEKRKIGEAKFLQEHACINSDTNVTVKYDGEIKTMSVEELFYFLQEDDNV